MTPTEKAKELTENFAETVPPKIFGVLMERDWITAKQCALIAVDEILNLDIWDWPHNAEYGEMFWHMVKAEIQKPN